MPKKMIIEFKKGTSDNDIAELEKFMDKHFGRFYNTVEVTSYVVKKESGFTEYVGPGICPLCGSSTCSGNCFK